VSATACRPARWPSTGSTSASAPEYFGQAADGARRSGWGVVDVKFRHSCFVPTVSALAGGPARMRTPFMRIADIPRDQIPFHDWIARDNTNHAQVPVEVARWVIARCTEPVA